MGLEAGGASWASCGFFLPHWPSPCTGTCEPTVSSSAPDSRARDLVSTLLLSKPLLHLQPPQDWSLVALDQSRTS